MEVYLLDDSFNNVAVIDRVTEFVVKKRFFSPGEVTLTVPYDVLLPRDARYIYDPYSDCFAVIEGVSQKESRRKSLTGRTLEALLERRVIYGAGSYTGNVESSVRMAVEINAAGGRSVAGLTLGAKCGLEAEASLEASWDVLSEWIYAALKPYGASYTIAFNSVKNAPEFRVITGIDRSGAQSECPPVVFSEETRSIENVDFELSSEKYCNTAYVIGADGTCVTVPDAPEEGIRRREMFVSAKDIYPDHYASTDAYTAALRRRGEDKLALCGGSVKLSGSTAGSEFVYGIDYLLGDICEVGLSDGSSYSVRVTAVTYAYEGGTVAVTPYFGDEEKTLREIVRDETEKLLDRS